VSATSRGTDIYAYEWTYDLAGNRTQQVFNDETTYYYYDNRSRLTHEITEAVPTYYQYDGCGNQTAKQEGAGTTYYQYDYENLMTQIDFPDDSHNYFSYDADGKRTSKADSEGYTQFIYQGPNMLALMQERDSSENTVVQYTSGLGLENMRRDSGGGMASGDSSFFHYDALGSTQELTDENETVTDTYRYNAWGKILVRTGTTTNPHTYLGKWRYYFMSGTALLLVGLRQYCGGLGRFLSLDPARDATNWYTYALNRATSYIDPWGRRPVNHDGTEMQQIEEALGLLYNDKTKVQSFVEYYTYQFYAVELKKGWAQVYATGSRCIKFDYEIFDLPRENFAAAVLHEVFHSMGGEHRLDESRAYMLHNCWLYEYYKEKQRLYPGWFGAENLHQWWDIFHMFPERMKPPDWDESDQVRQRYCEESKEYKKWKKLMNKAGGFGGGGG